jgi:thiamine-phosphate pyrophosphorylase
LKLPHPPLLVVTDRKQAAKPLADIVAEVLAAGCRWISVREKDLPAAEQLKLARTLLPLVKRYRGVLTLHGPAEIARDAGAEGVHLPAGADAQGARSLLGEPALIGMSVHSPAEAAALDPAIVDYVIAGPAYETASKPGYGPALGPKGLRALKAASQVPVVAIGGIAAQHIAELRTAGIDGVAVMGGVMRADKSAAAVKALLDAWRG